MTAALSACTQGQAHRPGTENQPQPQEDQKAMDYTDHYDSPLGGITLAGDGNGLAGLWFDGQKYFAETLEQSRPDPALPVFAEARRWLDLYFRGEDPGFTPALSIRGTEFRKAVWRCLLDIPYGETRTYGEIADRIARQMHLPRMSAQAVGGAVSHNAVSLIIPCHRVLGSGGRLTGYAGGMERKRKLLGLEKAQIPAARKTYGCIYAGKDGARPRNETDNASP